MAIDTVNKKLALISYNQPFNPSVPISSDGLGQDDKQHLIWQYPGILWAALADKLPWHLFFQNEAE
jgi:hypothetical protein